MSRKHDDPINSGLCQVTGLPNANSGRRRDSALVVDGHPIVAAGVRACVLAKNSGLTVEVADSLHSALDLLRGDSQPLLIVSELVLPDASGFDAIRCLRAAAPDSELLVYTASDDMALRRQATTLGIASVVDKRASARELQEAIGKVIVGHSPRNRFKPNLGLTARQLAVLDELAAGYTNRQIAARLNVSDETVGSHMKAILGRLGVKNRTEAVVWYMGITGHPKYASQYPNIVSKG